MAISWKEMNELQPRVMKLLYNSIEKDRLSHAYLFEGKKGTGKLDAALLLAKSFFCLEDGAEPCESCRNCKRIESGTILISILFSLMAYQSKRRKFKRSKKSFLRQDLNRIKSCILFRTQIK